MAQPDAKEPLVGDHPLEHRWVLYHVAPPQTRDKPLSSEEWKRGITEIASAETVEAFWRLFNNLEPLASLEPGAAYNFFKDGIQPEWEDPANAGGGRWYLSYDNTYFNKPDFDRRVDDTWMCAILCLIGQSVDPADLVCGIVAAVRDRETRFDVWTRKAPEPAIRALGAALKAQLKWCTKMSYRFHHDRRGRSSAAYYC